MDEQGNNLEQNHTPVFWPCTGLLPMKVEAECLSNGGQWEDKSAHNSKMSFSTNIIFVSVHDSDHDGVVKIVVDHL